MLLGYARVSTDEPDLTAQRQVLDAAGCIRLFEEKSGAKLDRPALHKLLDQLSIGDVVVVSRLDRLARSTQDLLSVAEQLDRAGAGLRSLAEPWADTTTDGGRTVLRVFAGMAEFERAVAAERSGAGRAAAKARGVRFGRPPCLTGAQIAEGRRLVGEGRSVREAAVLLQCHYSTLYRALKRPMSHSGDADEAAAA